VDYNFNVMLGDMPVVAVQASLSDRVATFIRLTDNPNALPLYLYGDPKLNVIEPDFVWLEKFLTARTFPRNRDNCADILAWLGLEKYDVWEINRKTQGITTDDPFWLRFETEEIA
jgi:hypothetical protein